MPSGLSFSAGECLLLRGRLAVIIFALFSCGINPLGGHGLHR
ncbi:MAG TPA: hypothetical protein VG321_05540 [Solirubrobacteraceae bacterium]|nr:hypothetical protein [Solirubrobacteraceae bacterium]